MSNKLEWIILCKSNYICICMIDNIPSILLSLKVHSNLLVEVFVGNLKVDCKLVTKVFNN